MLDKNKPQYVVETLNKKFHCSVDGVIVWFDPTVEPEMYWIDGGERTAIPERAEQDAREAAARAMEKYHPSTIPAETQTPAKIKGRGR